MLMFTLAISCLTTSYLPWFTDLTFQVPVQYCSLEHWTLFLSRVTSTTGYSFCLALTLHSFWVISPLISSSILGTYLSVEFIFQFPISLPFHTVHGVLKARVLKWFAIPFSSRPYFVRGPHFWSNYQPILLHPSLFLCFTIINLLKTPRIIPLCSSSLHSLCLQSDATSEIHEQCCKSANLKAETLFCHQRSV